MQRLLITAVAAAATISFAIGAQAADYAFTTVDYPGGTNTTLAGINNNGEVVGSFNKSDGSVHGFALASGVFTYIEPAEAHQSYLSGINDAGDIVGNFNWDPEGGFGFLYQNGNYTTLANPDFPYTLTNGINNTGTIVGRYNGSSPCQSGDIYDGMLITDGVYSAFCNSKGIYSQGFALNNKGDVVGMYSKTNLHAFVGEIGFWPHKGRYRNVRPAHAYQSWALGINDNDHIVGQVVEKNGNVHGFLLIDGSYFRITIPKVALNSAFGINNADVIVGTYIDRAGQQHGYIATPCVAGSSGCVAQEPWP